MPTTIGQVRKMQAEASTPVSYKFILGTERLDANQWLQQPLTIEFTGKIHCVACNRGIKKSYQQGYCFPCTQRLAACDMCILKPETCHYHEGTCREPSWGEEHCMREHIVYLANSSGLKVGITKNRNIPYRWLDQGACQAIPIFQVATRYQSGLVEEIIKQHMSDKTNWRLMLKGEVERIDLAARRDALFPEISAEIQALAGNFPLGDIEFLTAEEVQEFHYPVHTYPEKIKSYNLDKNPVIADTLQGIKGQYLIFNDGVINIRNIAGYEVAVSW